MHTHQVIWRLTKLQGAHRRRLSCSKNWTNGGLSLRIPYFHTVAKSTDSLQSSEKKETNVLIVGAGIAGLCSANYLLHNSTSIKVTLIDKFQIASLTSRINGGLICPSLSNSWSNYPIFLGKESLLSMFLKKIKGEGENSLLSFDPKLLKDRRFISFVSGWIRRKPFMKNGSMAISDIGNLSMDCYNNDDTLKSIDYDRTAVGTKTPSGTSYIDSSGDIFKFCNGLYEKISDLHGQERFKFIPNTSVDSFVLNEEKKLVEVINLIDSTGNKQRWETDTVVISAGNQSYDLCRMLGISCPIFPVKGYIVVFHSKQGIDVNLQLESKAFVSPIGNDKYHLSGCADFISYYDDTKRAYDIDQMRVNALIKETQTVFPDMEVQSVHCGFRPLSPDDIPLVGSTRLENVFLNTGSGSKGWTQGPGCGKLLSEIILGQKPSLDPNVYSPSRFSWW